MLCYDSSRHYASQKLSTATIIITCMIFNLQVIANKLWIIFSLEAALASLFSSLITLSSLLDIVNIIEKQFTSYYLQY